MTVALVVLALLAVGLGSTYRLGVLLLHRGFATGRARPWALAAAGW